MKTTFDIDDVISMNSFTNVVKILKKYNKKKMLKNRWAIITGSTGGIGSKISETLYLNKANIVILGRSDKKLKSLKKKNCLKKKTEK